MDKHIKVSKYFKSTDLWIEVALRSLTLQYVQDSWGLPGKKNQTNY